MLDETIIEKRFEKFWNAYPRRGERRRTETVFKNINPSEELLNEMLEKLEQFKQTEKWQAENGKFIPYPYTWLAHQHWEDEIITIKENNEMSNNEKNTEIQSEILIDTGHACVPLNRYEELLKAEAKLEMLQDAHRTLESFYLSAFADTILGPKLLKLMKEESSKSEDADE